MDTRKNSTVDWSIHKSARTTISRVIMQLLKKYNYPPYKRIQAITVVMKQVEKVAGNFYDELENAFGWVAEENKF
jgi:type I restriction enzyme R subunit